jgi:hypothetical protein
MRRKTTRTACVAGILALVLSATAWGASGVVKWTANGVALRSIAGSSAQYLNMTPDGSGGAIVTWYDNRSGFDDIYAQRVNSAGTPQWTPNGVILRSIASQSAYYPTITSDGSGGAIVTWQDTRSGETDIYAQRVDSTGTVQWTVNGIALRSGGGGHRSQLPHHNLRRLGWRHRHLV